MSDQGENFCQFDPSPAWRHAEHNIEILRGKVLDAVLKAEDGSPQIGQKGDYLSLWVSRPFRSPGKGIIRGCPDHCSNKGGVIRICGCKTTPGTTSDGDFVVKLDLEGEDRFGLSFLCSGGEIRPPKKDGLSWLLNFEGKVNGKEIQCSIPIVVYASLPKIKKNVPPPLRYSHRIGHRNIRGVFTAIPQPEVRDIYRRKRVGPFRLASSDQPAENLLVEYMSMRRTATYQKATSILKLPGGPDKLRKLIGIEYFKLATLPKYSK